MATFPNLVAPSGSADCRAADPTWDCAPPLDISHLYVIVNPPSRNHRPIRENISRVHSDCPPVGRPIPQLAPGAPVLTIALLPTTAPHDGPLGPSGSQRRRA